MSTKKSNSKALKKITAMIATAAIAFTATADFTKNTELKVFAEKNATRTLADGIYCIRNMNSNMYMDMCNNQNTAYTNITQYPYHGAMNQRFKVTYTTNSLGESYYTIRPMNAPGQYLSFDLGSKTNSCTNGTDLQTYDFNSDLYAEQRFTIEPAAGGGYQIGTWASNGVKVLEVTSSSTAPGAQVQIWDYSSQRNNDNWFFEPAQSGMAYNIVTNSISTNDVNDAQSIRAKFGSLGYDNLSVKKNCSKATIANDAKNANVLVFHGHGNAGGIKTDVDDGWIIPVANPKAGKNCKTLMDIIPPETAQHLQLVYFASCNSGSVDPTYGISLADAAYQLGAKCAIGFTDSVCGAEDYLLKMMTYISQNKYATIQEAMNYADSTYSKEELKKSGCPAKCKHVVGNPNIILDLRLPN